MSRDKDLADTVMYYIMPASLVCKTPNSNQFQSTQLDSFINEKFFFLITLRHLAILPILSPWLAAHISWWKISFYRYWSFSQCGTCVLLFSFVSSVAFHVQGIQEKLCFFHNSLQPLPRLHRFERLSKLSTQSECTVTPIGWQFFVQPMAAECWRGRGGKLSRILGKKHNI